MSEAQKFFFAECAQRARELPLAKAVEFLRGCIEACESIDGTEIQKIFVALSETDRQLELIQTGQMKLKLAGGPQ
jgi:hypothetical protein